jgi:hypothetical protein
MTQQITGAWSVSVRDAVWSFGRLLYVYHHRCPLGFWSKALLSSLDGYSPFWKTSCVLLLGHRDWMLSHRQPTYTHQPELPITDWRSSDPPSHNVGYTQKHQMEAVYMIGLKLTLKAYATRRSTQISMVPTLSVLHSLSVCTCGLVWCSHNHLTEEQKMGSVNRWFFQRCKQLYSHFFRLSLNLVAMETCFNS